jgi:hypothetical protein
MVEPSLSIQGYTLLFFLSITIIELDFLLDNLFYFSVLEIKCFVFCMCRKFQTLMNHVDFSEGVTILLFSIPCLNRFGNTAYLYISVAFIQMLKALSMSMKSTNVVFSIL